MASEEWDNDDSGSLFEGMVLFNPSEIIVKKLAGGDDDEHSNRDDLENQQQAQPRIQTTLLPPPTTTTASAATAAPEAESSSVVPSSSFCFQPLDENLFSDLTLITPSLETDESPPIQPHSDPPSTTDTDPTSSTSRAAADVVAATSTQVVLPSSSVSRQISTTRKKKRAGGLRIGHGRGGGGDADAPQIVHDDYNSHSVNKQQPKPEFSSSTPSGEEGKEEAASKDVSPYRTDADNDPSSPTTINIIDEGSVRGGEINEAVIPNAEEPVEESPSSIELRYEQIKAQISEKLNHAREAVASLSATSKGSIRRRRKAAEDLSLASAKYKEMEKKLEEACESEDFETAERVSESLASAERNKQLLAIQLRDAEADCDAVDSKMQDLLELQIAAEEECASLLQSFAMDAVQNADSVLESAELMTAKEMDKWLLSTEALEVKKMELEIESDLVHEARLVLNDSIEQSVKDDREESELLHKRKEMLMVELEKLLALVKQKEAQIAENDSNIEKVEKRIADVASGFQEAQSSIQSKYNTLQSGLSRMELDSEALSRKKKEIDDLLFQEGARGSKIRELGRISTDEANMYWEVIDLRKRLVQFISKSREDKVRLAITVDKLSEDVQMLKQEISAARASLQDLSSSKSRIQQAIESFKQRLHFIDKRVPELESEKKVAATARNFKEAARIATEAKTLSVEKESLQIKREEAMLELEKLEENISHNVSRLQNLEEQITSKENELAMARYQRLLSVAGAATAERSAAIELGDHEEADVLLGEAQAAEAEAKKLEPIYNFKEEDFETVTKHFISMDFVSNLGRKQLAELAASAHIPTLYT